MIGTALFMVIGALLGNSISKAFEAGQTALAVQLLITTALVFGLYGHYEVKE